jgi:hypothetical protein
MSGKLSRSRTLGSFLGLCERNRGLGLLDLREQERHVAEKAVVSRLHGFCEQSRRTGNRLGALQDGISLVVSAATMTKARKSSGMFIARSTKPPLLNPI